MKRWILLFTASTAFAQNWPSFRGTNASGVGDGKTPVTWNAPKGEKVLWKTEIPGLAHSSPIIWGNRVIITTAVSSDPKAVFRHGLYGDVDPSPDVTSHSWRVLGLAKKNGDGLWGEGAPPGGS